VILLAVALAIGAVLYKVLLHEQLGKTASLFIGIPIVLAILLALTPRPKSATGSILKGMTPALLLVAPLVGEGYLCILVASPLFYLVGIAIGVAVDLSRERKATLSAVSLLLLPLCLEGVTPSLSFRRIETVEVTKSVPASVERVRQSLAGSPGIEHPLPALLRIGFPRPLNAWGQGIAVGDIRGIHFAGAEGDPPGDLLMKVAESRDGHLRFDTVSDTSKLTQWLQWRSSEVEWQKIDDGHTRVTWRISFNRELDPSWYFAPLERLAVRRAAEYLIEADVMPEEK
jgi:hypothetical protein